MKQKMERMQVLNDGADDEDFRELLQILRSFGEVEVLYDPNDPNDKDVTADDVIGRFDNFKKKVKMGTNALNDTEDEEAREDGSSTEGCVSEPAEGTGESWRGSESNETDTTISTAA